MEAKGLHVMDALSEMALNDPVLMRALRRAEQESTGLTRKAWFATSMSLDIGARSFWRTEERR